jgi:polar amino acid transport system permease protein
MNRPTEHEEAETVLEGQQSSELTVVAVRHPLRWLAAALVLLFGAAIVNSLVRNPRFEWSVVGHYLFDSSILHGVRVTLELTAIAMAIGVSWGVVLAVMRLSRNPLVASAAWIYVWFFRGTPLLVQLLAWNFLSALYPRLSLGIPFGPTFVSGSANSVITTFVAAVLGLGLNEAAYSAEIVRAGLISVSEGQTQAAHSLGMTNLQTLRKIVLPQALRVIIPPIANETIGMLKFSSLASVIAVPELLYSAQLIYSRSFQTIPLLIVVSIWYIAITSLLSVLQYFLERRVGRGYVRVSGGRRSLAQVVFGTRATRPPPRLRGEAK